MSRRPHGLSAEDAALWGAVSRSVRPLRKRTPREIAAEAEPKRPPLRRSAPDPTPPPALRPRGPLADRSGERRVQRGQVEVHAKLDLHGHTQASAEAALVRFLSAASARGERSVIVVTGKGGRNRDGGETTSGVLRRRAPEWLAAPPLRHLVSGYATAHRRHGGEGALYVFLRSPT